MMKNGTSRMRQMVTLLAVVMRVGTLIKCGSKVQCPKSKVRCALSDDFGLLTLGFGQLPPSARDPFEDQAQHSCPQHHGNDVPLPSPKSEECDESDHEN